MYNQKNFTIISRKVKIMKNLLFALIFTLGFLYQGHSQNVLDGVIISKNPSLSDSDIDLHWDLLYTRSDNNGIYEVFKHDTLDQFLIRLTLKETEFRATEGIFYLYDRGPEWNTGVFFTDLCAVEEKISWFKKDIQHKVEMIETHHHNK